MNRTDILTALHTTPATLLALSQQYSGPHFSLRGSDEGDWVTLIVHPEEALLEAESAWGGKEALESLSEPTVGMLAEDAMLLLHLDRLMATGQMELSAARTAVERVRDQMTSLNALTGREDLLLGYIPLWNMDAETGALTLIEDPA